LITHLRLVPTVKNEWSYTFIPPIRLLDFDGTTLPLPQRPQRQYGNHVAYPRDAITWPARNNDSSEVYHGSPQPLSRKCHVGTSDYVRPLPATEFSFFLSLINLSFVRFGVSTPVFIQVVFCGTIHRRPGNGYYGMCPSTQPCVLEDRKLCW
jgi:hypothetical protein